MVLRLESKFDQGTTREGNSVFKGNPSRAHQCRFEIICSSLSKLAAEGIGMCWLTRPATWIDDSIL